MNTTALNEMADYLDRGEFGGRKFDMGTYQDCVLGHCAARELQRNGEEVTEVAIGLGVSGLSIRAFGISQSDTEEWTFGFGAQWGDNPHAAAYRLRDLARNKKAPPRELWDHYRKAPESPLEIPQELAAA